MSKREHTHEDLVYDAIRLIEMCFGALVLVALIAGGAYLLASGQAFGAVLLVVALTVIVTSVFVK